MIGRLLRLTVALLLCLTVLQKLGWIEVVHPKLERASEILLMLFKIIQNVFFP